VPFLNSSPYHEHSSRIKKKRLWLSQQSDHQKTIFDEKAFKSQLSSVPSVDDVALAFRSDHDPCTRQSYANR
jgi:hypothetical protein